MQSRGVESESDSHLKETPTAGPICLIWTFVCVILLQSVRLLCAIYLTTKTLLVHYFAPLLKECKNVSQVIIMYTALCHTISPRVGVGVSKKTRTPHPYCEVE